MAIKLSDSIRVGQQKPLEDKYFNELVPYTSTTQVNTLLPKAVRHIGLTVNINGEEYWYKSGIEDSNLILKVPNIDTFILKNQEQDNRLENLEGENVAQYDLINDLSSELDFERTRNDAQDSMLGNIEEDLTEKLDKGAYIGDASDLKSLIDTKADLVGGKVPASQLPSYVDDVLEFANLSSFPATGESGKIYIAIDTNLTYRWGGSSYVVMSSSLALGNTASTAYRGDLGNIAYSHSQTTGNPHETTKADIGLGNVPNVDATNPANISQSPSYRFFTDTERAKLTAITGSNTGDETNTTILTKIGYTPENSSNKSTDILTDKTSLIKYPSVKATYDYVNGELLKKVNIGTDTVFNFKNISAMPLTDFRGITPNIETIYFTEEQNSTGWQQVRYSPLIYKGFPALIETAIILNDENHLELYSDSTFNLIDVENTKINGIFENDFVIITFSGSVRTPETANQWFKVILKINGVQTAVSPVFYLLEPAGTDEEIAHSFALKVPAEMVTHGATLHIKASVTLTFECPSITVVRVHKSTNANL